MWERNPVSGFLIAALVSLVTLALPAENAFALPVDVADLPECTLVSERGSLRCGSLTNPVDMSFRPPDAAAARSGAKAGASLAARRGGMGREDWLARSGLILAGLVPVPRALTVPPRATAPAAAAAASPPPVGGTSRAEVWSELSAVAVTFSGHGPMRPTRTWVLPEVALRGLDRASFGGVRLSDFAFPAALVQRVMMHAAFGGHIARVDTPLVSVALPAEPRKRVPVPAISRQSRGLYLFTPEPVTLDLTAGAAVEAVPVPAGGAMLAAVLAAAGLAGWRKRRQRGG